MTSLFKENWAGAYSCPIEIVDNVLEGIKFPSGRLYSLDIETSSLDPITGSICLVQIYDNEKVYILDFRGQGFPRWFIDFLTDNTFIAHNADFEMRWLYYHTGVMIKCSCTMIMARMVNAAVRPVSDEDDSAKPSSSLASLSSAHLGIEMDKLYQKSDWTAELSDEQYYYAALDAVATMHLAHLYIKQINHFKMGAVYNLYKEALPVIVKMELNGFCINADAHKELIIDWQEKNKLYEKEARKFFGEININSTTQLGKWLAENHPALMDTWEKTEKGNLSFSTKELVFRREGFAVALMNTKKYSKLLNTYGESLLAHVNPKTKRIHGSFTLGLTATGRMSSMQPNFQNFPRDKEFRKLFVPSEGRQFVIADFSQIEVRVAGAISNDTAINAAYREGKDIYKTLAASLYNAAYEDVSKLARTLAKTLVLGCLYGMGAKKFVKYAYGASNGEINITEAEAKVYINRLYDTFSGYKAWCSKVRDVCETAGRVITPLGKNRYLEEWQVYCSSVNTIIQGASAEGLLKCLVCLDKALGHCGKIISVIHDEVVCECLPENVDEVKKILEDCMTRGMQEVVPNIVTRGLAEAGSGSDWVEAKG